MSVNAVFHLSASAMATQLYSDVMENVCGETNVFVCVQLSKEEIWKHVYSH